MKPGGVYIFPKTRLRNVSLKDAPGMYQYFDDMADAYRAEIWETIADYERGKASTETLNKLLIRALWASFIKGTQEDITWSNGQFLEKRPRGRS